MRNNVSDFRKVYITSGYRELRCGIDRMTSIAKFNFRLVLYENDIFSCSVEDAVTV